MGQGLRTVIQILLGLVIVALAYWLYVSITAPYEAVERAKEVTQRTRNRMTNARQALVRYERQQDRFPGTLDSLVMWIKTDSMMQADADSLFGASFLPDSLPFSPRTGNRFVYAINDTGRVKIYLLKDPDSEDRIGSAEPDVSQLNAASWE